jgi:hypothetical protein
MTDQSQGTPIEGLTPWVSTGAVARIIEIFARWLDAAPYSTEATLTLHQWDIHGQYPDHDLLPKIRIEVAYGRKGYKGSASIDVWRGADPERLGDVLAEALEAARAGHRLRKENGTMYHVPPARFLMEPEDRS